MAEDVTHEFEDDGTLVLEQRFAIVPEWVIDAGVSDCAFRLYAVLLRYGQTSGQRMPGRALLAARLHKSTDTVDRALKELVAAGAVVIERRRRGRVNLTNRYHLMSSPPSASRGACTGGGGRMGAATPPGRRSAATPGRTPAPTLAASVRPDPEVSTERTPPPTPSQAGGGEQQCRNDLLAACGVDDLDALARACQSRRRAVGRPASRWSTPRLLEVLHRAVNVDGWPASAAAGALLLIAGDPASQGPMRLTCPGPWWDAAERGTGEAAGGDAAIAAELETMETRLAEAGGQRVWAQQQARADLAMRNQPVTRLTVFRRACELLSEAECQPC